MLCGRRTVMRKPMSGIFKRQGLYWELDLNEGIDFAIWLTGGFERRLQSVYSRHIKPGMTVLDLGANVGAHTLPLARLVGPKGTVIAVEATSYAMNKLLINLQLNPGLEKPVLVEHSLLAAHPDETPPPDLYSSWPLSAETKVHPTLRGVLKPLGNARVTTVDRLVRTHCCKKIDWIKLDVDGHELSVLRGAKETLMNHRPSLFLEFAPYCHIAEANQFEAFVQILIDLNYRLQIAESGIQLPRSPTKIKSLITEGGSINVLASAQGAEQKHS